MVYDRRPSNDYDRRNQDRFSFHDDESSFAPRRRSTSYSREQYQKWLEQRRQGEEDRVARQRQEWFDSLAVFDLDGDRANESTSHDRPNPSPDKSARLKKSEDKKSQKEKEKEEEEEKKKKQQKGWFPWLNRGRQGDRQQSDKAKLNRDKNQNGSGEQTNQQQAKDKQQPNDNGEREQPNPGSDPQTNPSTLLDNAKTNAQNSREGTEQNQTSEAIDSASSTSIASIPAEPVFIAPSPELAKVKPENIIGKTDGGGVIYISQNPSADRANVQSGIGVRELPSSQTEKIYAQQQQLAQTALDSVKDTGNAAQQNIRSTSPNSLTRISHATANATALIESQIAQQQSAIAAVMNQSRSSITAASQQEIAKIENHYASTISAIDTRTATAVNELKIAQETVAQEMAATNATFTRRIDSVIDNTHAAFTLKQQRATTAIETVKRSKIKQFRKQSPAKSDNPIIRALDNIGWSAYVTNWRQAKIQVAETAASQNHDANEQLFSNNFAQLAQYRASTIGGGQKLLAQRQLALSNGLSQQQQALSAKAQAAKAQAAQLKQQLIAGVRQTQAGKLGEIDVTQTAYQQTLEQRKQESNQGITSLGANLRTGVAGAIANGERSFAQAVAGFTTGINTGGGFASLANAPAAAELARTEIETVKQKTQDEIETATTNAESQLGEFATEISQSLKAIAQTAANDQRQQLAEYTTGLQQSANTSAIFHQILDGYSQTAAQTVVAVTAQWQQQSVSLMNDYQKVEGNLQKQLNTAESQIDRQRATQLTSMANEIDTKAPIEAEKVQPGWKKVVKIIVNVVITVAVTVAIAALALSGVGLVALIGLGALIGAAGGIAKLAANDLIDGKRSSADQYLKAGAIGAATGVLEAVGARAVAGAGAKLGTSVLTKIEHMVASTGIETVTNTLVEMTEAMGQGQEFTLKLLGISVASSLLSAAGGKYIDFKFADIGQSAARGAGREASEGVVDGVADSVARQATRQGFGREISQFATETAFDTAVETGASVARGEELTLESFGENLAAGVLGRGAAGRADKLYGNKLRSVGSDRNPDVPTSDRVGDRTNGNSVNRQNRENSTSDLNPANNITRKNYDSETLSSDAISRQPVPTNQGRNPEFERVASVGLSVPVEVYSDPNLAGNTVRAEYKLNSQGVVENVHLRAGPDATAADIKLHQHTVKVMRMYGGTLGRVRIVEAKIAKWVGIHGQPQTGTRAWEAQHEVPKLEKVIGDRLKTLSEAEPEEAARLETEIEYLQDQLVEHRRAFEIQDESIGVGYIAAEGYADVHDHYSGKLDPEEFLSTTSKYGKEGGNDYSTAIKDLYDLLLDPDAPEFKLDALGRKIPDGKNGGFKPSYEQTNKNKTGKENIDTFRRKLNEVGMLDKSGRLVADLDPDKAERLMLDLLSATDDNPFDTAYAFRRLFRPQKNKQAELVSQKLIDQEIEYAELQGHPGKISKEKLLSSFANDKLQAWFLGLLKGSDRLSVGTSKLTGGKNGDLDAISKLGEGRTIGLDFAGAETERFSDGGMGRWRNFYNAIDTKAKADGGTYVLRTHVGEGSVKRDASGKATKDSEHRDIANHNVGKVVDTLVGMNERGEFSDNVITRLGHMTHSDFEQLSKLDSIGKEHGVIVEANLTSNLKTGTVENKTEMRRVLLKFLYQDNLRVTLNTDGGGVMNTTIENEYKEAQEAIDAFKSGKTTLIDEKGKIMYYYSQDQIPREIPFELLEYDHVAIPESKQKNYNIERLRAESDRYIDDVAPTIGSAEQRKDNIDSVNRHKQKAQAERKRKQQGGEEPPEKRTR